jgi:hypothetical protein
MCSSFSFVDELFLLMVLCFSWDLSHGMFQNSVPLCIPRCVYVECPGYGVFRRVFSGGDLRLLIIIVPYSPGRGNWTATDVLFSKQLYRFLMLLFI